MGKPIVTPIEVFLCAAPYTDHCTWPVFHAVTSVIAVSMTHESMNTLQCKSGSSLVPLFLLTGNFLGIL